MPRKLVKRFIFSTKDFPMPEGWQIGTPSPEQLDLINQFALAPMADEDLFVFPCWSCNDQEDRDLDQFVTDCVKGFLSLDEDHGPIGKSFMAGHHYGEAPEGRIFDASNVTQGGITWLVCWVYMAITPENYSTIQQIKAGVHWAVSVGVEVAKATCNICKKDAGTCGHRKGQVYDGKMAIRLLSDPVEFIELSGSIVLGAQYGARTAKGISIDSIVTKIASHSGNPRGYSSLKRSEFDQVLETLEKIERDDLEMPVTKKDVLEFLQANSLEVSLDELKKSVPTLAAALEKALRTDALEVTLGTVKTVLGDDISEVTLKGLKVAAANGETYLKDQRAEASRLHKIANKGVDSPAMVKVIESADLETVKGLVKEFEGQAEAVAPLLCPKCGEKPTRKTSTENLDHGGLNTNKKIDGGEKHAVISLLEHN